MATWQAARETSKGDSQQAGHIRTVPGARGPLSFTVVRTTAKPITELLDLVNTSVRTNQSVRGTTTMRVSGNNHVNVTPYVGTRIGSCRHARIASLNSIRNTSVFAGLV